MLNDWYPCWFWTVKMTFFILICFFLTIIKYEKLNKYQKWQTRAKLLFLKWMLSITTNIKVFFFLVVTFLCIWQHEYFIWFRFLAYFSFIVSPYIDKLSACSGDTRYRQGAIRATEGEDTVSSTSHLLPWQNYSWDVGERINLGGLILPRWGL